MSQRKLKSLLAAGIILPLGIVTQSTANAADVNTQELPKLDLSPVISPASSINNNMPSLKADYMEYSVPCLTVWGDGSHGKISYLPLKFTRTKENKPLRIMIADDTPNGSGKAIHSSVWLAAVTAAMLRNDTMHGTTISVEFSGNVDGPSAGGVTCLAILSAMDGLPLPNDFAMTGTILPDGTIGVVGGVPEKMRAAAKAGKKRIFIPAFLRFEKNSKGENIDLQRLADELKVKLYRVENIGEAYAVLHGKKYSGNEYVNVRDMTRLPQATEDVLTATYKKYLEKVKAEVKAQPKLVQGTILSDYVLSPRQAEMLYQEGKLLPATLQIFRTWQAWQAWKKTDKFFDEFYKGRNPDWSKIQYLREYHFRKLLFTLRDFYKKEVDASFKEASKLHEDYIKKHYGQQGLKGYFPFRKGQSEFVAQLEPVDVFAKFCGLARMLEARRADEKVINFANLKDLDAHWNLEVDMIRLLYLLTYPSGEYEDFLAELAATLPNKKANKRAVEVERLFYSASYAADSVAGDNFTSAMSAQAGRKNAEDEVKQNPYFLQFIEMQKQAWELHQQLQPDAEKKATYPEYHLQASLKAQVTTFTMASALLVMYGPDSANDFVPHRLRNARSAAIRNINECIKANIPCIAAIYDFEMAESATGSDKDTVAVLMSYWRASLYAKAMLMSFK